MVLGEEQQLRDRYKAFNVAQLQTLASQATGSDGCASITKLAEGGFNKVFRLQMNDGKTILARIPNPNAGPAFYTRWLMRLQGSRHPPDTGPSNLGMECNLS